jgi:pimeloyl-ACP methyl ester carboxylesterase
MTISLTSVSTNGIELNVATAGAGAPLLLLHGFPHTWEVWSRVIPTLSEHHLVVAPDLRGLGASTRAGDGYDLQSLTRDVLGILDALGIERADIAAIDAGAPVAFYLSLQHPERVRRLVLMEAILGTLPRPSSAPLPWWFGFHAVPEFAERVVHGNEEAYIGFFLDSGMLAGEIEPGLRSRLVEAYRGRESLRAGFEHYRALPANAVQIDDALASRRLSVPTLAIGSNPIGAGLHAQLEPISDDLRGELISDSGHIIPLDRPEALLEHLGAFFGER